MTRQYGRIVRVTIGTGSSGILIENLRIEFDVKATRVNYPNVGTVKIYNLAPDTRSRIKDSGDVIEVVAGYQDNVGTILLGNIRTVNHGKKGADIVTMITCGDGDEDYQNTMVNATILPESADPQALIRQMASEMRNTSLGEIVGLEEEQAPRRPVVISGNMKDEMNKLGRKHNFEWTIQNGTLEVVRNDLAINEMIVLSSESGMIGSPAISEKGIKVKCLLNPRLRPNRMIQVLSDYAELEQSSSLTKRDTDLGGGIFRIDQIAYTGNNRDGDFYCDIDGVRMYDGRTV